MHFKLKRIVVLRNNCCVTRQAFQQCVEIIVKMEAVGLFWGKCKRLTQR